MTRESEDVRGATRCGKCPTGEGRRASAGPRLRLLVLALLLALPALPAQAETYRVDLIVFLDKSGAAGELGHRPKPMDGAGLIDTGNTAALKAAGIELLPEAQFALQREWQHLRNSKNYQPLFKLAWTQKDPPGERGPALRVKFGQSFPLSYPDGMGEFSVSPVEGSVALLLGRYLHLDADLQYTLPTGSGSVVSYRLQERRRMRRNELHHLDSPRIGILAMVAKG